MDNLKVHHATYSCQKLGLPTVKEQLTQKKIYPRFLPPYTPQLNPVELCFNIIRQYVKRHQPRTFEELKNTIDEVIAKLQQEDLSKHF
jgi:transposase